MTRTLQSKLDKAAVALWDVNGYGIIAVETMFDSLAVHDPQTGKTKSEGIEKLTIVVVYDSTFDTGDINFASGAVLLKPKSRFSRFFSRIKKKLR